MRVGKLLTTGLLVVSLLAVPQPVGAAEDKWRHEQCTIINSGRITGTFSSPLEDDAEWFAVRLQQGQMVDITVNTVSENAGSPELTINWGSPEKGADEVEIRGVINASTYNSRTSNPMIELTNRRKAHFEIWAKESGTFCFVLHDDKRTGTYDWSVTINRSAPDVNLIEARNLEERIVTLQNRINRLQRELEKQEQIISSQKTKLNQKTQRINTLENRVSTLKRKLNSKSGDVTIKVTVVPRNDRKKFVVGGTAIVKTSVVHGSATLSDLRIVFGKQIYKIASSGKVNIPLVKAGVYPLQISYLNTTKAVKLHIRKKESDLKTQKQPTDQRTSQKIDGFTLVAAIAGLGLALLLSPRLFRE